MTSHPPTPPLPPGSAPPPDGSRSQRPADWLDLYLDDALDDHRRALFEAEMARDSSLRAAVEQQRRIDGALRDALRIDPASLRLPVTDPSGEALPLGGPANAARGGTPARRLWWMGVAAAVLLGLAAAWSFYMTRGEGPRSIEPADLYARMESGGFTPEFVCRNDEEFAAAVTARLGTGLLVSHAPDVELLGWAYANTYQGRIVGPDTLVLMCKLDAKDHVLVLMDKASSDRRLQLPEGSPLRLFRRRVGPLVLYELTPLDRERVIPRAYLVK